MRLNVNATAVSRHAAMLERMSKQALPNAIRGTLNTAAFNTKQKTMPVEAADAFEKRKPNFFKANSRVEMARGSDVTKMRAVVGFLPKADDKSHSVEDLEQQERGGDIPNRSFVALKTARTGNAWNKMVRSRNRLGHIRKELFNAASGRLTNVKNGKEAYTLSAIYAAKGGFVLGDRENSRGNRMVFYINSVKRVGRNTKVNATPVYAVKGKRKVRVKRTQFMEKASVRAAKDMNKVFIAQAERELNKLR